MSVTEVTKDKMSVTQVTKEFHPIIQRYLSKLTFEFDSFRTQLEWSTCVDGKLSPVSTAEAFTMTK